MAGSAESFTLLESGTSRLHFKLAKELEEAGSSRHQDRIILATLTSIRKQLASRSWSSHVTNLSSALLTLLHCFQHYPCSAASASEGPADIDASFALLPTLQLLGLATSWKQLLIAYQLLPFILPRTYKRVSETGQHKGNTAASSVRSAPQGRPILLDDTSSLLLLNTFRSSLSAASDQAEHAAPLQHSHNTSRARSRAPTSSRSPSRAKQQDARSHGQSDGISYKAFAALKSLIAGTPQGPAVLPSLASTLVALTRHPDSSIRSMTLNAMLSCAEVPSADSLDNDGGAEVLDAALTIVRLTLASTYAFEARSNLEQQHNMILAEMDRRIDSSPNVLRACVRIVDRCREAGLITDAEAACHALEALQATRWAPMQLDIPQLQQQGLASTVVDRTEGLRARAAARQNSSLQRDHDYHSTYAPWLVDACLSSCTLSIEGMLQQASQRLDQVTKTEVLKTVLRIYHTASQGKAAALALCVSAARCIGALHLPAPNSSVPTAQLSPAVESDGELVALWSMLAAHVKSQLHSSNPNRKIAAITLLDALLPLGWAQATNETEAGQAEVKPPSSPLHMTEAEMGQLMGLLADPDASIRKRALALLHRVDPNLTGLLQSQLQMAVDDALTARTSMTTSLAFDRANGPLRATAQRLIEVAIFAVHAEIGPGSGRAPEEALADLQLALTSGVALNLFGTFAERPSTEQRGWLSSSLLAITSLPISLRVDLLQRLFGRVSESAALSPSSSDLYLGCCLLVDVRAADLQGSVSAAESFVQWVGTDLLSSSGVGSVLLRMSGDGQDTVLARETVLGVVARTLSLVALLDGSFQSSQPLLTSLEAMQATLSKLIEAETVPAVRLEADNLLLLCRALLTPASQQDYKMIVKLKTLATSCLTAQDSARFLLELRVEDQVEDSGIMSSPSSDRSLLATAAHYFAPSSTTSSRSEAPVDSFAAVQLRSQLPDSVLHSSRLLSPGNSTDTLRSSKHDSSITRRVKGTIHSDVGASHSSAIPSESKRLPDQGIARAMSNSIANLVLGADARTQPSDSEVIFSASSSEILEADELETLHEVADPGRCLDVAVAAGQTPSLLDLVHQCHNHDPWLDTTLTPFVLDGVQIGFLPARVVQACLDDSASQLRAGAPPVLRRVRFVMNHREILPPTMSLRTCEAIAFTTGFATPDQRTSGLNAVAQRWREARIFPDPLDGWRDELYAIYGRNPVPGTRNPIAFKLERAACALFGFATYGVHLTAYTVAPETGELKVWVPQRSSTKSTWPGYLDNSVAGGIVAGDLPMESTIRECEEEANLEPALVKKHIKQTGVLSYCYKTANQGWIQPEVEYVYDLPLPSDVTLQPKDGEVDHFELMTLEEVYEKMREGRFKANCVLVLLDFLVRHGYVTAENEVGYRAIAAQLHVDLRLPGP